MNKETIIAEIDKLQKEQEKRNSIEGIAATHVLLELKKRISALPFAPLNQEVEDEIKSFLDETGMPYFWAGEKEQLEWLEVVARHFSLWQKAKCRKEDGWRPASELPDHNDNVIALYDAVDGEGNVISEGELIGFAHKVFPGQVVSYDGWNIPHLRWWKPFVSPDTRVNDK